MKWYGRLIEYMMYTALLTFCYYPVVIPWFYFVGHMTVERLGQYLWQGYLIDLAVAYPIGKFLVKMSPKIKQVCGFDILETRKRINQRFKSIYENIISI